ncbi:MAG: hypothetical protein QME66_04805 [Candidatus Eisenbacteria bacterium]|nr:hypothetical protein [Candidatus Eisenbacteria bacterium]
MNIALAKNLSIETIEYASQGNAILGIRDSGKSYTATYIAEQLLQAKIPFIAFDPIGVWKYLKLGKNGNGCQVVVAGSEGDLPLTPESAPNIVRAAMQENIPLVLDLYSIELTKADWKRIVEQSIRLLLYENKQCGLRHVFIEEAAEFVPQRVGPDQGKVYAEIEKLARMGGNASLGYTLINQRAEEVNKAVLELCDCLILHRQKGRHSLNALGKWLDVADVSTSREIIKSLPSLGQGECWIWRQGSHAPTRVKVNEKKTIHPDRRNPLKITGLIAADVSTFIHRMKTSLEKQIRGRRPQTDQKVSAEFDAVIGRGLKSRAALESEESRGETDGIRNLTEKLGLALCDIEGLKNSLGIEKAKRISLEKKLASVRTMLEPQFKQMQSLFSEIGEAAAGPDAEDEMWAIWLNKLNGKNREMLRILIERKRVTRQQLGLLVGMSPSSGSFNTYISKLKSLGLMKREGEEFVLQEP